MGADLYINSLYGARKEKYQLKFDMAVETRNQLTTEIRGKELLIAALEKARRRGLVELGRRQLVDLKIRLEVEQNKVDRYADLLYSGPGYYRDSYNGTSVLWRLGLSWWKDVPVDNLTVDNLKKFRNQIASRKLNPVTEAGLRKEGCKVDGEENSVKVWQKFFRNKKRRLIRFLDRAAAEVEKGGTVNFSV